MEASANPNQKFTFRPSFTKALLWTMTFGYTAGAIVASTVLLAKGTTLSRFVTAGLYALVAAFPLALVGCTILWCCLPQRLSVIGVSSQGFLGRRLHLRWEDISRVQPISMLGLRYLRLHCKQCDNVVWLPLFISRKAEFKRTILALAPVDNPIRAYFA